MYNPDMTYLDNDGVQHTLHTLNVEMVQEDGETTEVIIAQRTEDDHLVVIATTYWERNFKVEEDSYIQNNLDLIDHDDEY